MEEGGTTVPRSLSAGVTLKKLVVQTVDENWTPTYVQEASSGKGDSRSGRRVWEVGGRGAGIGDGGRGKRSIKSRTCFLDTSGWGFAGGRGAWEVACQEGVFMGGRREGERGR